MVGVVLRHIHFDQERGRLYPIIMRVAWLGPPGPCEPGIAAGLVDLIEAALSYIIGKVVRVKFRQRAQRVELPGVHLGGGKTRWLALKRGGARVCRQDVGIGLGIDDSGLLQRFVERMDHLETQIVFARGAPAALCEAPV